MNSHVSISYQNTMNLLDFRQEVAEPIALRGARTLVHDIVYEKQKDDEHVFDNKIVIPDDPYVGVALVPRAKHLLQDALVGKLKDIFEKIIDENVSPYSQAEKDNGIPGDVMDSTPVKLRATNADELLTFTFGANLNLINVDQPIWQNVTVEINYTQK